MLFRDDRHGSTRAWEVQRLGCQAFREMYVLILTGCRTCRRRRLKCDEHRPTCERCQNGGFECEGYLPDFRFVDENSRTVRHVQKASLKQQKSRSRDVVASSLKAQVLPAEISLVGFQDNLVVSFLLSHIFSGMARNSWMERQAENTKSATAQNSILALSNVYFGRMHRQQNIVKQGFASYGKALSGLNTDLQDEEKAWSLSTLASSMTLELYEVP